MFMTLVPAPGQGTDRRTRLRQPGRASRQEVRPARLPRRLLAAMGGWLRARRHRREVETLLGAEPGMLRDLGLTRLDLAAALAEPLWRDPSARLLAWSEERRAARAVGRASPWSGAAELRRGSPDVRHPAA